VLARANSGALDDAAAARQLLIERYGPAVRGYLLAAVGVEGEADDLAQEFALALIRGEFRGADRQRGRFRSYVKSVLFHLVAKHRRKARRQPRSLVDLADPPAPASDESQFDRAWREELLNRAWRTLEQSHPQGFAVLRLKAQSPRLTAEEIAQAQSNSMTAAAARQQLHRARERFAHYLIDAVAHSLRSTSDLEDELRQLDLLSYCREVLERYRA
jgi:RNA polymerase sigma-70 factor (ECF subfamily)